LAAAKPAEVHSPLPYRMSTIISAAATAAAIAGHRARRFNIMAAAVTPAPG
jgi:hypothetical protein